MVSQLEKDVWCRFGLHKWVEHQCKNGYHRICRRCGVLQEETIGSLITLWREIPNKECEELNAT